MPRRSQKLIRRDINRLLEVIRRHKEKYPQLAVIESVTASATEAVNTSWQAYQQISVRGDKERMERDKALRPLIEWIQGWRAVILMLIPGVEQNLRNLPSTGPTPDDVIRVATDMVKLIEENPAAASFKEEAFESLGEKMEIARRETDDAVGIRPNEAATRKAYSEACLVANDIIVKGSKVVRSIFGRTSPEYKQLIIRAKPEEEEQIDEETNTGESEPAQ